MSNNLSFTEIWKRILSSQGEIFYTISGLPFTYTIKGARLRPSRTDYNISLSDIEKAYQMIPLRGPSEINDLVRGPAYVWAILHDPRIRQTHSFKWAAVCHRCNLEHNLGEYEKDRFCRSCGSMLNLEPDHIHNKEKISATKDSDEYFVYNLDKSVKIAEILHGQFQNKTGYFEGHIMPEYILPEIEKASKELAQYFTYVIAIDYQTDAHKLWRNSRRQYSKHPELFQPETILEMPDDELTAFVRMLGARFPNNGSAAWKKISRLLLSQYEGDPRNLTPQPLTYNEVKSRLNRFPHLRGPKLSNLYLRVMGDMGLLQIADFDKLDVAVDVQISRFTFYTGSLKLRKPFEGCVHNPPFRPAIENLWRGAASKIGCAPWHLDQPMWVIASNQCTRFDCGPCPVINQCERNFEYKIQGNILKLKQ